MDNGWMTDLRYVLRVLGKSPGFLAVAVVSLAVGIGANAAMFGMVRGLLLEPLSVDAPEELALLGWRRDARVRVNQWGTTSYPDPEGGGAYRSNFSYPVYESLRAASAAGVDLFAFHFIRDISVGTLDSPPMVAGGLLVDGHYFSTLRVPMELGRPLTDADHEFGAPLVAVLSHSLWMRAFGGDPAIVGRTIRVNGVPAEVVGVTGEGFRGMSRGGFFPETEVTVPFAAQPLVYDQWGVTDLTSMRSLDDVFWLRVMARIPRGEQREPARQAFQTALRSVASPLNEPAGPPAEVGLLDGARGAQPVRASRARLLLMLLGVVGIVLVIACVNLAALMLARGVARQREMAVRRALGGGRLRLIRQSLLESLVLAAAGTLGGLVLAYLARGVLSRMVTSTMGSGFGDVVVESAVDPMVVLIAAGLGVACTVLFGLLPAVRMSDVDPMKWLKHRSAGGGNPKLVMGRLLLALQIGVSVPLVVGAALFLRTISNLGSEDLGFDPENMAMFYVNPVYTRLPEDQHVRLFTEIMEEVRRIPGVTSVTLMRHPFMSGIISNNHFEWNGRDVELLFNYVGPDFTRTTGMRLLAGRMPGIQDGPDSNTVGVLNETAVAELFGGAAPLGEVVTLNDRDVEIIGVVNDGVYDGQRRDMTPTLYYSALQGNVSWGRHVVFRSTVPVGRLEAPLREALARVDGDLPVPEIRTQRAQIADSNSRERIFTQLLTLFGGFALLLASIGLHGVTSYTVARRTSEFGVRVALGARPGDVQWLVLRQVLVLAGVGLLMGVPASLAAGPLVGSLLYEVAANDLGTIAAASLVMLGVALAAGFRPARRAARMHALTALREE